jgi:hypothetical protein
MPTENNRGKMETTYEFSAYNSEKLYGYGSQSDAQLYLKWLNKNREINQYEMAASSLTDEDANTLAFNLRENLADLDSIESGDN